MAANIARDVLIRVSVENGDMKLGPVDTSSILDAIKAVQKEMQDRIGSFQFGAIDTSAITGAFSSVMSQAVQVQEQLKMIRIEPFDSSHFIKELEAIKAAANEVQDAVRAVQKEMQGQSGRLNVTPVGISPAVPGGVPSIPSMSPSFNPNYSYYGPVPAIGHLGYGQSVRDRARAQATATINSMSDLEKLEALHGNIPKEQRTALEMMQKQGQSLGITDEDISKLQARLQKKAEVMIRERDRETAASEAAAKKQTEADIREWEKRANEARKHYSAIMSERERMAQQAAQQTQLQHEQNWNVANGGARAGRGGMMLYAASGNDTQSIAQMTVAAEGLHSVYSGLTSVASGMGVTLSAPFLAATAAVTAGIGALALYQLHLVETRHLMDVVSTGDITRAAGAGTLSRSQTSIENQRRYDSASAAAMVQNARYSVASGKDILVSRGDTQRRIADFEDRTDVTPHQKAAFRQREEINEQGFEEREKLNQQRSYVENLLKAEKKHQDDLEKQQFGLGETYAAQRQANADKYWELYANPDRGSFGRSPQQKLEMVKYSGHGIADQEINKKENDEKVAIQEKITKSIGEQVALQKQQAEISVNLSRSYQDQFITANKLYQTEKELTREHGINTGSLDFGDLNRRKMIQDKHFRIEAKREANRKAGRPLNEGAERYTQEEIRIAMAGGDVSKATAEQQAQETRDNYGLIRLGHEDEAKAKAARDRAADLAKQNETNATAEASKTQGELNTLDTRLASSIGRMSSLKSFGETIINTLNTLGAELDEVKARVESWTQSRRNN